MVNCRLMMTHVLTGSDHELAEIEKYCQQLFEESYQETAPGEPDILDETLRN